jgi:hypothetical protein
MLKTVEPIEPRCRVCRDPAVRRLVNDLLDWHGVPVILEGGSKLHRITYVDILDMLEPVNEDREERDRITYDSLRIHAKRHHDLEGIVDYWSAWFHREVRKALGG